MRHHLCRQGVALASTRQLPSQGPVSVQADRTEGVTGSGGREGANGVGGGIGVGGRNGDGNGVGNGDENGHGDGAGAGAGTGVEVNEGAQDGNGDGSGDGAGTGTRTGMETSTSSMRSSNLFELLLSGSTSCLRTAALRVRCPRFLLAMSNRRSRGMLLDGYTKFMGTQNSTSTVDEGKGRLNHSREKNESKHRRRRKPM